MNQQIRELTCITCPMGCTLYVCQKEEGLEVRGNGCPRGEVYGRQEVLHPLRMITTTLPVCHGTLPVVSCKTASPIPKEAISALMQALQKIEVQAPVKMGQVLLANAAGTGVDVIATKEIQRR